MATQTCSAVFHPKVVDPSLTFSTGLVQATKHMYTKHLLKIGEVLALVGSRRVVPLFNKFTFSEGRICATANVSYFLGGFGSSKIAWFEF